MTFFDCTADLAGQLNGNGHNGMLQIDAPPVENFCLHHRADWQTILFCSLAILDPRVGHATDALSPFIPVLCHSARLTLPRRVLSTS